MDERVDLTDAMKRSGTVIDWQNFDLNGPVIDKHSTGGVGDKVSLMLAPIVAACGGFLPMITGRGLGHTTGTVDKMNSIPGYQTDISNDTLKEVVQKVGCAIIGQTNDIAPADRRFYATRDITATVESVHLITSSILSKKMAAGLDALVMDVKFGSGAFMDSFEGGLELAESIVAVGNKSGLKTTALLTDMNQVLGKTAGNALETLEAVRFLKGEQVEDRLFDVTTGLCAELLVLGNLAKDANEGQKKAEEALSSGRAVEIFSKMVSVLGGPTDFVEKPESYIKSSPIQKAIYSKKSGYISRINAREIGLAIIELGGGRRKATDQIDLSVGFTEPAQIGQKIDEKTPLIIAHGQKEEHINHIEEKIQTAFEISDTPPVKGPVIARWVG